MFFATGLTTEWNMMTYLHLSPFRRWLFDFSFEYQFEMHQAPGPLGWKEKQGEGRWLFGFGFGRELGFKRRVFYVIFGEMCVSGSIMQAKTSNIPVGVGRTCSLLSLFGNNTKQITKLWAARQVDKHANIVLEGGGGQEGYGIPWYWRLSLVHGDIWPASVRVELSTWV